MTWFNPTSRGYHNCYLPRKEDGKTGDYWRCEVCDEIWQLVSNLYSEGVRFTRVRGWFMRRRFRNLGWTKGSNENATDPLFTKPGY